MRWGRASNADRLKVTWREHRGLVVAVGLLAAVAGAWLLWDHVTAFGGWLDTYAETIRNLALAVGVVAAIFGGWVAYRRSQTDRVHAETDRRRQVTESFEGAVTLLGHRDRSVRLGAIYALERIARQNRDEHWPIMETLTAYVREWSEQRRQEVRDTSREQGLKTVQRSPSDDHERAPADIQAVFTVLGRRRLDHEDSDHVLNLTGAYLVQTSPHPPPKREFARAILSEANLDGADLNDANLEGAVLWRANLYKAWLANANLSQTNLAWANLEAYLYNANLRGASPLNASLKKAELQGACLEGADLNGANLESATLSRANLTGADLSRANLRGAFLSRVVGLTQEQLNSAVGDADTEIPEGLTRPGHW